MFDQLRPSLQVDRIDRLDLGALMAKGIKGLIIDIDNTLTGHDVLECDGWAVDFIALTKRAGFKVCLLSNNNSGRVSPICGQLDVFAVSEAGKPQEIAYRKALKLLGLKKEEVAAVGDQLFTDILGGNRAGLFTILVKPLSKKEAMRVRVLRPFEKLVKLFIR